MCTSRRADRDRVDPGRCRDRHRLAAGDRPAGRRPAHPGRAAGPAAHRRAAGARARAPGSSAGRPRCSSTCRSTSSRPDGDWSSGRVPTSVARCRCSGRTSTRSTRCSRGTPARSSCRSAGPWTLAATLEKTRGDKVLSDHGARRDLTDSLAEGVRLHVAEVSRRIPGAQFVLQLDEPGLPAVLAGDVPTVSGFGRLRVDRRGSGAGRAGSGDRGSGCSRSWCTAVPLTCRWGCCARPARPQSRSTCRSSRATTRRRVSWLRRWRRGSRLVVGAVPTTADRLTPRDPSSARVDATVGGRRMIQTGSVGALRTQVARLWQRLDQPPDTLGLRSSSLLRAGWPVGRRSLRVRRSGAARDVARALADDPEV